MNASDEARFWSKVDRAESCWRWLDAPDQDGYGRFNLTIDGRRRNVRAHRLMASLHLEGYSEDLVVRHSCDNPRCVNPAHLVMGTQADNIADRSERGRGVHVVGSANGRSKLTDADIRAIRAEPITRGAKARLARQYGVAHGMIRRIIAGSNWRHVESEQQECLTSTCAEIA